MNKLINNFKTTISENNGTIRVNYFNGPLTGHCEYTLLEVNNRLKQKAWVLINTDMGDVIEYIYQKGHIKDGDFNRIGSELQDYSLSLIHDHQSHQRRDDE